VYEYNGRIFCYDMHRKREHFHAFIGEYTSASRRIFLDLFGRVPVDHFASVEVHFCTKRNLLCLALGWIGIIRPFMADGWKTAGHPRRGFNVT
jgi:hypothetical protein